LRVGILSYQGDVKEHLLAVERCGAQAWPVKYAEQLGACDALIIPGGESTTIGKLIVRFGLVEPLREFAAAGKPVFGTCAGLILLAKNLVGSDQFRLNLMDIVVERNAYGRQTESFEAPLESSVLGAPPLHGVFIRAPKIKSIGKAVEPLAYYQGQVVFCRQGNLFAATFHPELTADDRVHRYFLGLRK